MLPVVQPHLHTHAHTVMWLNINQVCYLYFYLHVCPHNCRTVSGCASSMCCIIICRCDIRIHKHTPLYTPSRNNVSSIYLHMYTHIHVPTLMYTRIPYPHVRLSHVHAHACPHVHLSHVHTHTYSHVRSSHVHTHTLPSCTFIICTHTCLPSCTFVTCTHTCLLPCMHARHMYTHTLPSCTLTTCTHTCLPSCTLVTCTHIPYLHVCLLHTCDERTWVYVTSIHEGRHVCSCG